MKQSYIKLLIGVTISPSFLRGRGNTTMIKHYTVEIGGDVDSEKLDAFMRQVDERAHCIDTGA